MTWHQRRLHADLQTPVSAYLKLQRDERWSFLFESVEGSERWASNSVIGVGSRRSFVGREGTLTLADSNGSRLIPYDDPLTALRQAARLDQSTPPPDSPRFIGGIFGFIAYDAVRTFEPVGGTAGQESPEVCFVEPELLAVFDNRRHTLTLHSQEEAALERAVERLSGPLPVYTQSNAWQEPTACDTARDFQQQVRRAVEYIRAGDIIQVVLSRRFELPRVADIANIYRGLRTINPSPYLYAYTSPELQFAGASPEVMVRVQDRVATVRPIAGTRPRGETAEEDTAHERSLMADPKELAEHVMLVDLGRNDLGRVCRPGSVRVTDKMLVERYSHVMHIVSEVQGHLEPDISAFDAVRATFPAGTLSGAPKVRAMQIIDELEARPRGLYGGAVGYFAPNGDADFGIAIRTLTGLTDRYVIQAGAGIVADSDPETETRETEHKARAVVRAAHWAASTAAAY